MNARYYSPKWRRFISPDSTEYLDPESINGLNLYCYCNHDPVNLADPSGNEPTAWWEWLVAGAVVAGLAVGTFFTGGLLAGALMGAAIGAGISLGTQAVSGELNWRQFALDTGVGALTGMLGASSITRGWATAVGAAIGFGSNIASQLISGDQINWWKVGISTVIGGVVGFAGGAGARNTETLNNAPKVAKALRAVNKTLRKMKTAYYSDAIYAQAAFTKVSSQLGQAIIRQQQGMFIGAMGWYAVGTVVTNIVLGVW